MSERTKHTGTPDTAAPASRNEEEEEEAAFGGGEEEEGPTPRRLRRSRRLEQPVDQAQTSRRPPMAAPPQPQLGGRRSRAAQSQGKDTWDPGGGIERRVTRHGAPAGPSRFAMLASVAAAAEEATSASDEGGLQPTQPASEGGGLEEGEEEEETESEKIEEEEPPAKRPRPSRPGSAFMYFMYEFRQKHTGGLRVAELSRLASKAWSKMTPEEKEPYEKLLEQEKVRYAAEKEKLASPTKESRRESDQPRRPKGSFFYFLAHFKEEYRRSHPNDASLPVKVLSQLASKAWAEMSVEARQPFKDQAEAGKKSYAAWKTGTGVLAPEGPEFEQQLEGEGANLEPSQAAMQPAGMQQQYPAGQAQIQIDSLAAKVKDRIAAIIAATAPSPVQSQGAAGSLEDSFQGVDQPIVGLPQSPLSALQQSHVLHGVPIAEPQQGKQAQQLLQAQQILQQPQQVLMPAASRTDLQAAAVQQQRLPQWQPAAFQPYQLPQGFAPFQPQQAPQQQQQMVQQPQLQQQLPLQQQQQPQQEFLGGADQASLARRLQEQMSRQMAVLQNMSLPTPPQLAALAPVVQQQPQQPRPPSPQQAQAAQQVFAAVPAALLPQAPRALTPLELAQQQLQYVINLQELLTAQGHLVPPHLQQVQQQVQVQQPVQQQAQPPSFVGHVFTQQQQPETQQPFPSYYVVQGGAVGQLQPTLMPPSLPHAAFPAYVAPSEHQMQHQVQVQQPQVQQQQPQLQQEQLQPQQLLQQQQPQMMQQQPTASVLSGESQLQAIYDQLVQEEALPQLTGIQGGSAPAPAVVEVVASQPPPSAPVLQQLAPQTLVETASTPGLVLVTPQLPPLVGIAQPGVGAEQEATPSEIQGQGEFQSGAGGAAPT